MTTTDRRDRPPGNGDHPGIQQLRDLIEEKRREAARIPEEPVLGPDGEHLTRQEAEEQANFLRAKIYAEKNRGSLRHRTVKTRTKVLSLLFLVLIDFPVMLWLVSAVFNVNWSDPIGLPLLISVVLSVLATAGAAWVLYHLGHNRRIRKDSRCRLDWSDMSLAEKVSLFGVATLVTLIAVVMFVRVYTEGELSGLRSLALLLAVLIALIMLLSAALVFFTAFRDGSPEQEDLAHYSASVRESREREHRFEDQIAQLESQMRMLQTRGTPDGRPIEDGIPEAPPASGTDDQTTSYDASDAAAHESATNDAQVTRIHERRPPQPPHQAPDTGTRPSAQDRPAT
jgi:hypothetical protein